jgi:hypothetical protein
MLREMSPLAVHNTQDQQTHSEEQYVDHPKVENGPPIGNHSASEEVQ